jgi:hypothetical protein
LLKAYELTSAGKVVVSKPVNADPESALAEGIRGFDLDKGQGCYLGLALSSGGKKEVLAQLSPAWEQGLEADLSRAIERVSAKVSPTASPIRNQNGSLVAVEDLRTRIPNFDSLSLEDALRTSRTQAIEEFNAAATRMNQLVQEAQASLVKAQKEGSAADQEAAMKKLQELQATQTDTLKQIAAGSQARIEAITKVKPAQK